MIKRTFFLAISGLMTLLVISCSSGPTAITNATLARGYDQSKTEAVGPTTTFSPTDHIFHLVVNVGNPGANTKVGANWTLVEAGSIKDQNLDSKDITLASGENVVHFSLTNTEDWPPGKYKVDITLNGRPDRTLEFQVE